MPAGVTIRTSGAAAYPARGLGQERGAGRPGPLRLGGPEVAAEVAEAGRRQQGVAHRMGADVAVGVPGEALRLVRPVEPEEVQGNAVGQAVDVHADTCSQIVMTSGHAPDHARATINMCGRVRPGRWPVSWRA